MFHVARDGVSQQDLGDPRVFYRRALRGKERKDLEVKGKGSIIWQRAWMKTGLGRVEGMGP